MIRYKFGDEIIPFDSEEDAITYAESIGADELIPAETPSEMRERAKVEYTKDVADLKASEQPNNPLTYKIAETLFPNLVAESKMENSSLPYKMYEGVKDASSFLPRAFGTASEAAGDLAATAYYGTPGPSLGSIAESMRNTGEDMTGVQGFAKRMTNDPLLIPMLGIGSLGKGAATGTLEFLPKLGRVGKFVEKAIPSVERFALGSGLLLGNTAIEKAKVDETPSGFDLSMALAAGILPEVLPAISTYAKNVKEGTRFLKEAENPLNTELIKLKKLSIEGNLEQELPGADEKTVNMLVEKFLPKNNPKINELLKSAEDLQWAKEMNPGVFEDLQAGLVRSPGEKMVTGVGKVASGKLIRPVTNAAKATIPGLNLAKAIYNKSVPLLGQISSDPNIVRAIISSFEQGQISPTERNAYLRAVETGNDELLTEYVKKYRK